MAQGQPSGQPSGTGARLRVLSYNVHSLRDDYAALAAVVRGLQPDVVIVQEAPRRFRWRQKCAALADSFGMVVAVGGLPSLGNLLLTTLRVRVPDTWCLQYPLTPGRHLRGAAFAQCSIGGRVGVGQAPETPATPRMGSAGFVVAGSHLATDPAERPTQATLLKEAMSEASLPLILGADINENSGGAAWRTLADGMIDTAQHAGRADRFTYSCVDPHNRIDAIFVDPRITVVSYDVVDTPEARRASDHFPVLADLLLPAG